MARGTSLGELVDMLRDEVGHSSNPAMGQNARPGLVRALQRAQNWLYADYNWPFMRGRFEKLTQAGERYYDFPAELNLEKVEKVEIKWGSVWRPISFGLSLTEDYTSQDSDADARNDPIRKWDVIDVEGDGVQFEVWPVPASNDLPISFTGIRSLPPLTEDASLAALDDELIVLMAAARILARQKSEDAPAVQAEFNRLYGKLRGRVNMRKTFVLGGGDPDARVRRPGPVRVGVGTGVE